MLDWERDLLSILEDGRAEDGNGIIAEKGDPHILYALSEWRQNVISWMDFAPGDRVLEVCANYGEITCLLASRAGEVDAVCATDAMSRINRARCRGSESVRFLVGDARESLEELGRQKKKNYDWILVIPNPDEAGISWEKVLPLLAGLRAPGGRIVLALSNRMGMNALAGERPDMSARTRADWLSLLCDSGYGPGRICWYYPYPNYFFTEAVYSDEFLPSKMDLTQNLRNFYHSRETTLDEEEAYDRFLALGSYREICNSYLCVLEEEPSGDLVYCKYSNQRDRAFSIRTEIRREGQAGRRVFKLADRPEAADHVRSLSGLCRALSDQYRPYGLSVNQVLSQTSGDIACLELEYVEGEPLSDRLTGLLRRGEREEAGRLIRRAFEVMCPADLLRPFHMTRDFSDRFGSDIRRLGRSGEKLLSLPVTDIDMIFSNILIRDKDWILIDYEWSFSFPIPVHFLHYRALHYLGGYDQRWLSFAESMMREYGLTAEEIRIYRQMEACFQAYVSGPVRPMRTLYLEFGAGNDRHHVMDDYMGQERGLLQPLLYWDEGKGFLPDLVQRPVYAGIETDETGLEWTCVEFDLPRRARMLRFDPMSLPGILQLASIEADGRSVTGWSHNGQLCRDGEGGPVIYFDSDDPQILIPCRSSGDSSVLKIRYQMDGLVTTSPAWQELPLQYMGRRDAAAADRGSALTEALRREALSGGDEERETDQPRSFRKKVFNFFRSRANRL